MNKNFSTIKMVREIRDKQYNDIKNKSHEEIIKYFREKSNKMNKKSKIAAGNQT